MITPSFWDDNEILARSQSSHHSWPSTDPVMPPAPDGRISLFRNMTATIGHQNISNSAQTASCWPHLIHAGCESGIRPALSRRSRIGCTAGSLPNTSPTRICWHTGPLMRGPGIRLSMPPVTAGTEASKEGPNGWSERSATGILWETVL